MIEIRIHADSAQEAKAEMRALLSSSEPLPSDHWSHDGPAYPGGAPGRDDVPGKSASSDAGVPGRTSHDEDDSGDEPRVYGSSSEGRARRTKEEMAEDKEIDELAEKLGVKKIPTDAPASEVLAALREKDAATPEEDEAPEATRQDLLDAMSRYVDKVGQVEAMENLPDILGVKKQSELPDDPEVFAEKIAALETAIKEAD